MTKTTAVILYKVLIGIGLLVQFVTGLGQTGSYSDAFEATLLTALIGFIGFLIGETKE